MWDSPAGEALAAMIRSAVSHEPSTRMLRQFITTRIPGPVVEQLGMGDAKTASPLPPRNS